MPTRGVTRPAGMQAAVNLGSTGAAGSPTVIFVLTPARFESDGDAATLTKFLAVRRQVHHNPATIATLTKQTHQGQGTMQAEINVVFIHVAPVTEWNTKVAINTLAVQHTVHVANSLCVGGCGCPGHHADSPAAGTVRHLLCC